MGGAHAINISRYYENTFDRVGVFSSAHRLMSNSTEGVYANFDHMLQKQIDNGVKLYWLGIGKDDFLYEANKQFRAKLDSMGMKYTYMETEGGHIWRVWRIYPGEFAQLIFQ